MPHVIVSINGIVLREMRLEKDRTTLGRRPYNDIVIDNLAVSGEHALLHRVDGEVYLEDLKSTNGTSLNARAITRQLLQHNDLIEIGKYKILYLVTGRLPDPAAASAESKLPVNPGVLATINILSGPGIGRSMLLEKPVTTIGKPGVAVAAVTRRRGGYVLTQVEGSALLNALPLGSGAATLKNGDVLELAATQMRFDQA